MAAPIVRIAEANRVLPTNVRVASVIAAGGQGAVYRGTVDGNPAAIKLYTSLPYEVRVDREVDALRQVSCVAVAGLSWAGTVTIGSDDIRVVATQLIDGDCERPRHCLPRARPKRLLSGPPRNFPAAPGLRPPRYASTQFSY